MSEPEILGKRSSVLLRSALLLGVGLGALIVSGLVYPALFSLITFEFVPLGPFRLTTFLGFLAVVLVVLVDAVKVWRTQHSLIQYPMGFFGLILIIQLLAAIDRVFGVYSGENAVLVDMLGRDGATITLLAIGSVLAVFKALIFFVSTEWLRHFYLRQGLVCPRPHELDSDPSLAKLSAVKAE